jgi:hypothetical protein
VRFLPTSTFVRRLATAAVYIVVGGFATAQDAPLKVAVYDVPPYRMSTPTVRLVASASICGVAQMEEILKGIERKGYDAAIGAIMITPGRLARVDLS